jgi:uncharacterized protein (TIGR03067 family)
MRRTVLLLAGVLLSAVALGSDSPKEYDDSMKVDLLEGEWRMVEVEVDGVKPPFVGFVETYRDASWGAKSEGNETHQGRYKINTSQRPARLDLIPADGPFAGVTRRYIYQVSGDVLKTAEAMGSDERPKRFDEKRGVVICTYKRVKK